MLLIFAASKDYFELSGNHDNEYGNVGNDIAADG